MIKAAALLFGLAVMVGIGVIGVTWLGDRTRPEPSSQEAQGSLPDAEVVGDTLNTTALREIGLKFHEIVIKLPSADPRTGQGERVYTITGWINLNLELEMATEDEEARIEEISARGTLFVALRELLTAYRNQDLEGVLELYDRESQQRILDKLETGAFREEWLKSVGAVRSVQPLVCWVGGGKIYCLLRSKYRDGSSGKLIEGVLPVVFYEDTMKLTSDTLESDMYRDLVVYFQNPKNLPRDIIAR